MKIVKKDYMNLIASVLNASAKLNDTSVYSVITIYEKLPKEGIDPTVLGYYDKIIEIVSDITNFDHLFFNLSILIPFGIGVVIGLILLAKILLYLLNKYKVKTYFAIIGFIIGSIIVLIFQIKGFTFTFINIITCLITFIIGYFISIYIAKK